MWDPRRKILVKPYDALQAFRQFFDSKESDPDPESDYFIYFLMATLQGFNPEIQGLELVMLNKMDGPKSIVAYKARREWIQYHHEITFPESAGAQPSLLSLLLDAVEPESQQQGECSQYASMSSAVARGSKPPTLPIYSDDPPALFGPPRITGRTSLKIQSINMEATLYGQPAPFPNPKVSFSINTPAAAGSAAQVLGPLPPSYRA